MCGDLDEEEGRHEGDLYRRFLGQARALLDRRRGAGSDLDRYLDELFDDTLRRCIADAEKAASPNGYRQMAMQSLVMARLAGFLAGHVALNEDPLRKVIEAMMLGYQEAEHPPPRDHHGHDHGHDHDHHHGHDDDHGGGHSHVHSHPGAPHRGHRHGH